MGALVRHTRLVELDVSGSRITDAQLPQLAQLTQLSRLIFGVGGLSPECREQVERFCLVNKWRAELQTTLGGPTVAQQLLSITNTA